MRCKSTYYAGELNSFAISILPRECTEGNRLPRSSYLVIKAGVLFYKLGVMRWKGGWLDEEGKNGQKLYVRWREKAERGRPGEAAQVVIMPSMAQVRAVCFKLEEKTEPLHSQTRSSSGSPRDARYSPRGPL